MEKIYLVINKALHPMSSYYEVIGAYKNEKEACGTIGTLIKDTAHTEILGNYNIFYDDDISENGFNCSKGALMINKEGYYELFEIQEIDLI